MTAPADAVKQAMPFTTRYPELGTGPVDVRPLIDPELFELERERIFKQVWLYVARAEEIAQPGDYKLRRLDMVNTSVIIVRDKSGQVHAFHNLCTHRGNKLIPEQDAESLGHTASHLLTCRFSCLDLQYKRYPAWRCAPGEFCRPGKILSGAEADTLRRMGGFHLYQSR